ncbi:ATP-binding protein [Nostoc sp. FACHB-152]|uniref:AAA family ATPase n=1 Tax=unclassified Nostoc TaxID=2593658 RepID=UPI00168A07AF|nr:MULTISPECIES: ATP-binding protein [unclassified Nostoc]MBD2452401.1 ATP-binding protein [Nostoc sp. FACHB-152]MBD2473298.1 ATP-binding protein [Nostoc sp. FACHB-145]
MAQSQLAIQPSVEALTPQLDLKTQLAKVVEIEEIFNNCFIPTDRACEYFRWLDELRILKQCGRVIGPRDVGKSRASLHYREEDRKKVSYVRAWSASSSKRLFSQILKDINHAAPTGKREDLRPRLAGSLELFGIEQVIVDNADNLQKEAFLDLKQLFDESNVSVVLVGGQELDKILYDFDLLTSFPTLYEFDRLEQDDFQKTLNTIEFDILALPEASNLYEGATFEILAASTGGRIGLLIKILTKAVLHSLKNGFSRVDQSILEKIANRYGRKYIPPENRNKNS